MTAETARVCVDGLRESDHNRTEPPQPQDGGGIDHRGRGHKPRRYRYATTTNYTLRLCSSSSGRESNLKITLSGGGLDV